MKRNFSLIVLRNYHKRYFPRKVKEILILIWILINLSLDFAKFNLFIDKTAFPCRVQGKKKIIRLTFGTKKYIQHTWIMQEVNVGGPLGDSDTVILVPRVKK